MLDRVTTRIIVPHRGLEAAKTRLSPVLSVDERHDLACRLLRHVLTAATEVAPGAVVVISPSAELEELVVDAGARLVVQRGLGLNTGLEQARAEACHEGVELLAVVHGDLPNLSGDDLRALLEAVARPRGVALATDRGATGTNGLAMRPAEALPFRFGRDSHVHHAAAARSAGLPFSEVHRPGLSFDLDTPADLARWRELGDAA